MDFIAFKLKQIVGSSRMIVLALSIFIIWAVTIRARTLDMHGIVLEATTMITFLIVFVLQRAQNRDMKAIHVKLDELIAAIDGASNRVIKAEEAPAHILEQVHEASKNLAKSVLEESRHTGSLSIEDHMESVDRVLESVVEER